MRPRPGALLRTAARAALVSAAVATLSLATPARADGGDASGSFDFGLSEMLAGRYATGCPAIEASLRADPRPGTLFTLADCERKWGKTASALARFAEFLAEYDRMPPDQKAKQRERASVAGTERASLEKVVPLLTVRVPVDAPAGTRVWRDDVELTGSALAAAAPVDPGEHVVRATFADGRARESRVTVADGEQKTLVVELPLAATAAAPPAPPPPLPAERAPVAPPAERASHVGWTYAAAGVGVASLVVAGVTGGIALGQKSIASPVCSEQGLCTTQRGVDAGNEAHTMANVETGALVVGGVALAAALVLWLTEPRRSPSTTTTAVRWTPTGAAVVW